MPGPAAPFRQRIERAWQLCRRGVKWSVNRQTRLMPALLVALIRNEPYAAARDRMTRFTQSLGTGRVTPRMGSEIVWTHTVRPATNERHRRWLACLVASRLVRSRAARVVDVVPQQQSGSGRTSNYLAGGIIRVAGQSLVPSAGLSGRSFGDCLRIPIVVLLHFDVRANILGRHQPGDPDRGECAQDDARRSTPPSPSGRMSARRQA